MGDEAQHIVWGSVEPGSGGLKVRVSDRWGPVERYYNYRGEMELFQVNWGRALFIWDLAHSWPFMAGWEKWESTLYFGWKRLFFSLYVGRE